MTDYQRGQQDIITKLRVHIEAAKVFQAPEYEDIELCKLEEIINELEAEVNDPFKEIKK